MERAGHQRSGGPLHKGLLLGICTVMLSGCSALHSARMWAPQAAGMEPVGPHLYVEPAMPPAQRQHLLEQIEMGHAMVAGFYGSVTTQPYIVACITQACDQRFGSYGGRAAAYGDMAIRLSPDGLSAPLIAHEWSHAEVYRRVGGWWAARQLPRWFDEGIAVVVANEARHTEHNWQAIQDRQLPVPALGELVSFSDWGQALQQYGETAGDVPGNFRVVYTTAGHAVRDFLSCAGMAGLHTVLAAMRAGTGFDEAYRSAKSSCTPH